MIQRCVVMRANQQVGVCQKILQLGQNRRQFFLHFDGVMIKIKFIPLKNIGLCFGMIHAFALR